jgi:hypothetical protein
MKITMANKCPESEPELSRLEQEKLALAAQLNLALAKTTSESLAMALAEESLRGVERQKNMLELELKKQVDKYQTDIDKKDSLLAQVHN